MAAGHRIYSFCWEAFTDLTSNPQSERPASLAGVLADPGTRERLDLPTTLPTEHEELTTTIRDLFLQPEWFAGQPKADVKLRNRLLMGLFFDEAFEPLGISVTPAWRPFYECCSFDIASVLAGRMALDLERMKRGKGAYYRLLPNAEHNGNEFWWFGRRPYRYTRRQASDYSIHSPEQVNTLSHELATLVQSCESIECAELHELLADYTHCIEGVKQRNAGMFVENDT